MKSVSDTDLHLRIEGRVQGVGFRESMILAAQALGVSGWVRNRTDGSVEAVLRAKGQALEELLHWAHRGPPAARVEHVAVRPAAPDESAFIQDVFSRLETR